MSRKEEKIKLLFFSSFYELHHDCRRSLRVYFSVNQSVDLLFPLLFLSFLLLWFAMTDDMPPEGEEGAERDEQVRSMKIKGIGGIEWMEK